MQFDRGEKQVRKMHLAAHFHPTGNHVAAWHHPQSQMDAGINPAHYLEMAQTAERGKFDLIFLADSAATRDGDMKALKRWPQYMAYFEPLTLLSAMAAVTKRVGLVATATTSFSEPYNLARLFGSLDHLSGGRAGWNVVTSGNIASAYNFGLEELPDHSRRYQRAEEFLEITRALWDSWEDDALVMDRETGEYFLPEKLHRLNHKGEFFSVRGPLNQARPPQGYPVIFQAGTSETGKEMAARQADVVFVQEQSVEKCQQIYADIKERMPKYGRSPDQLRLMPGIATVVGRTEEEARETHEFLQSKIHPDVGLALLSAEMAGADLTGVDVDAPMPPDRIPETSKGGKTTLQNMKDYIARENPTVRELYRQFSGARGSRPLIGSPAQIADAMVEWFDCKGADGFIVQPSHLPGGLNDFVELVIPELQKRGVFRKDYEGPMLRDHLGLSRPAGRYATTT
jgi:N-acetyl-S-(2-succino)cysteine monooxygenase